MKKLVFPLIILLLALSACVPAANTAVEAELRATLVGANVQLTVQANEIDGLHTKVFEPTATCPVCPTLAPTPTDTPTPTPTIGVPTATSRPTGSISGKLGYPSQGIPPLRIVAMNTLTGEYYWQNTVTNQSTYSFPELPVGKYRVLAYVIAQPSRTFYAGYSEFVTCGLLASCPSHALITVEVKAGQDTPNVDPIDWYATDPEGIGWPLDPTINWN